VPLPLLSLAYSQARHLFAGGNSVSIKSVTDSLGNTRKLAVRGVIAHLRRLEPLSHWPELGAVAGQPADQ
jgi:hypothetical protein